MIIVNDKAYEEKRKAFINKNFALFLTLSFMIMTKKNQITNYLIL